MNLNTAFIDKIAISLSSLCMAHCLIFPLLASLLPSFLALGLHTETFHLLMVVSVIPTSIYALSLGCKKHAQASVFFIGLTGLCCLILAFALGSSVLTEAGEKALTLTGALIIAIAHVKNFKLCQQHEKCACPSSKK